MIEATAFVMAILGCGDAGTQCADARVLPARYATAAECRAQLPTALARHTDLDFPTVMADCREQGPRVARVDMKVKPKG